MEKILVTTDLSANSASAIRFAYKISQLRGATLVIVHVYHVLRPSNWREHRYESYCSSRREFILNKLTKFLDHIFSHINQPFTNYEIDLQMSPNTITSILDCATKHRCIYICISIRGAGKSKEIMGTIASKLIVKTRIPIISIPSSYKAKAINSLCYATDMVYYQKEIKKVLEFASPLKIAVKMLHIVLPTETLPKIATIETRLLKRTKSEIKVKYVLKSINNTLDEDINLAIKRVKPSLIVFFINQSTTYFNSIFYPPNAQSLSILSKIPLVSFKRHREIE